LTLLKSRLQDSSIENGWTNGTDFHVFQQESKLKKIITEDFIFLRNFHQRMNCTILEILTKIRRLFVPKSNALIVPPKFNPRQRDERAHTDFTLRFKLPKQMVFCGLPDRSIL